MSPDKVLGWGADRSKSVRSQRTASKSTEGLGQRATKTRTYPSLPDDSFAPLADGKINEIRTVAVCH